MSSGIMERNLPVAESLGSGDKVRIVTAAGNSKNIDASEIGGGGGFVKLELLYDDDQQKYYLNESYNEIFAMVQNNIFPYIIKTNEGGNTICSVAAYGEYQGAYLVGFSGGDSFSASSADASLYMVGGH